MSDNDSDNEGKDFDPEEEVVGDKYKIADLPIVMKVTGEEDQQTVQSFRSKFYRFNKGEWKERGVGTLKFLKNKETGMVRLLMRAEKTLRVIVNHLLQQKDIFCQLKQMKTAQKSWTWSCYDFSDDKPQVQKFCAKFTSKEEFNRFKQVFELHCKANSQIYAKKSEKPAEEIKPAEVKPAEEKPAQQKAAQSK